jgi:rsbT co-antagonist protein RsbR
VRIVERGKSEPSVETPTPLVEIWDGILMVPIVGILDSARTKKATESILEHISHVKTDVVIISIGGISAVDTKTANHLLRTVHASKLMGTEAVITGISAEVAMTLVDLGLELSGVKTFASMHYGLQYAFEKLGWKVERSK